MDRDATYRQDILDSINDIEEYLGKLTEEQFFHDKKTQDSIIRRLEIIGEASKRLSAEFKAAMPAVDWKVVAGTRDVLIHDYGIVNIQEIWKITTEDLPKLKSALEK
ncbi:MAG: hypothetical protein A2846_01055 [Candidatus Doudnabacteria bacterium RIFCSPHIGHO2_01_FULL_49_9]|uniref:DUF86 domain-containing protein n=1 Tax=Candidatus Doudnabacteria bacterium RIFCSPHIGHO2_01_FULL_49_9 TaxID=1817827 RepID=A0A1F5P3R9_9BACT|nr:MAG: hypothetical protein A2846_01055 [Candidatus Doudnabacteria bacterium RIFCSPHIGHO2_01_FULL_49_9]